MSWTPQEYDAFKKHSIGLLEARDGKAFRSSCKRLLVLVWSGLSTRDRDEFISHVDVAGDSSFVPPEKVAAASKIDESLKQIMDRWPAIIPHLDEKERGFGLSIKDALKRPYWKPSEKQERYMRNLWKAHMSNDVYEVEIDVVEEE